MIDLEVIVIPTSIPTIFSISHENLNLISSRSRNVNSGSQVVSTNCP